MPKSPEQKIMKLEAQVKLLEKQKAFVEQQAFVADKKAIIFYMMIDIAEKDAQTTIPNGAWMSFEYAACVCSGMPRSDSR